MPDNNAYIPSIMNEIKLRQLRFFVKVVETRNITRAAEQLNIAQTALGRQIRNLEDGLKTPLLKRHSRGVTPTSAGVLLYRRAISILRQIEDLQHEIAPDCAAETTIRFGTPPSTPRLLGVDLLRAARETIPGTDLHIVEEPGFLLVDALVRGDLDFILAHGVPDLLGIHRIPLLHEDLLHVSGPGYGARHGLTDTIQFPQALSGDLALLSERDVIWQIVHETAEELSLPVHADCRVQSVQGLKSLIMRDIVQSIAPYGIVAEHVHAGNMEARRIVQPPLSVTLFLAWSEQRQSPVDVQKFRLFIDRLLVLLTGACGSFVHPLG